MAYNCEVKEQAAQPTLVVRKRAPVDELPRVLGESYLAIMQYIMELGEEPVGPPFAAYHNMDMQDLDVEIGFPVSGGLPGKGDIRAGEIPGGKVATCLYVGPYDRVEPAYNALAKKIEEEGCEATGVAYEMYLNDPGQTPPEELRTLILLPLK